MFQEYKKNDIRKLPLVKILLKEECQNRTSLNVEIIKEYKSSMEQGDKFPPIEVFEVDGKYILVDGFHRVEAQKRIRTEVMASNPRSKEFQKIEAIVISTGTMREATLYATTTNRTHGLQRTTEDKKKAIRRFCNLENTEKYSERQIARTLSVTPYLVRKIMAEEMVKPKQVKRVDREVKEELTLLSKMDDEFKKEEVKENALKKLERSVARGEKDKDVFAKYNKVENSPYNYIAIQEISNNPDIVGIIENEKGIQTINKSKKFKRYGKNELFIDALEYLERSGYNYMIESNERNYSIVANKDNRDYDDSSRDKLIAILNVVSKIVVRKMKEGS